MAKKRKDQKEKQRADLKKLLGELEAGQEKLTSEEGLSQTDADALEAKAEETEALQKEIEEYDAQVKRNDELIEAGRKIKDPIHPADDQPELDDDFDLPEGKKLDFFRGKALDGKRLVGYVALGDYVVASKGMEQYQAAQMPFNGMKLTDVPQLLKSRRGEGGVYVPVSREMAKAIWQSKSVPTIGTSPVVIEPTLLPELVRVTEHDALRLRDVLNIGTTASDAVKYTRIVSYTRAASTVARSAVKPEAALDIDAVTVAVSTIAVHIPVEEQQLSDYPALSGIINGELLYDLEKHVEELVMYGAGTGEDFLGIINDPAVGLARTEVGDTLIDTARRAITDVRRAGYEPNGILIDPLDWEDVVLEKGSDNRYVWVVVTEGATQRLWSVPVVETVAMEDFTGSSPEERNMLVGDFLRGATLWDRERSSISVGLINDQFIRNQRTILGELRAAFGVRRPGAFRKHVTQVADAS